MVGAGLSGFFGGFLFDSLGLGGLLVAGSRGVGGLLVDFQEFSSSAFEFGKVRVQGSSFLGLVWWQVLGKGISEYWCYA